eukprot:3062040-Amphidinium_carterae.1
MLRPHLVGLPRLVARDATACGPNLCHTMQQICRGRGLNYTCLTKRTARDVRLCCGLRGRETVRDGNLSGRSCMLTSNSGAQGRQQKASLPCHGPCVLRFEYNYALTTALAKGEEGGGA